MGRCAATAEGEPRPRRRAVARDEQRVVGRTDRSSRRFDELAEDAERVKIGVVPVDPEHEAEVVLAEPVAERLLEPVHIDSVSVEDRPHPAGEYGAAVLEPSRALLLVDRQQAPDHLVDVLGDLLDGPHGGGAVELVGARLVVQLLHEEAKEAGLSDPVGPHEGGGVDVTLGEPAGVLDGRCR